MSKISNHRTDSKGGRYIWQALMKAEKHYFILTMHADSKIEAINKIKKLADMCKMESLILLSKERI